MSLKQAPNAPRKAKPVSSIAGVNAMAETIAPHGCLGGGPKRSSCCLLGRVRELVSASPFRSSGLSGQSPEHLGKYHSTGGHGLLNKFTVALGNDCRSI